MRDGGNAGQQDLSNDLRFDQSQSDIDTKDLMVSDPTGNSFQSPQIPITKHRIGKNKASFRKLLDRDKNLNHQALSAEVEQAN